MADERYIEEDPELDQGSEATEEDGEGAGLYEHFAVVADKGQTPLRLDKFLTVRMEKCSRNRIQAAADCGNILVNGKPAKSSYKVKPLDRIQIVMPYPRREVEIIPEDIPLEIPYEDDDLLIVNKPAGLVVHPGHGNYSGTLVNALTYHLRNLPLFQEGDMRAGLVHRIDKNTSGLLVVAKNEQAHARLAKQFFDHTIQRRYVALVWGNFDQDEGTITGNIGRSPRDRQKMFVFEDGSDGKHAVTHWRVLKRYGYVTLVECRLETGRTHQIRVHMSWQGHPLFNDERYGGDRILKGTTFSKYRQFVENCFAVLPRHALHARSLGFVHPTTRETVYFESELPSDFRALLEFVKTVPEKSMQDDPNFNSDTFDWDAYSNMYKEGKAIAQISGLTDFFGFENMSYTFGTLETDLVGLPSRDRNGYAFSATQLKFLLSAKSPFADEGWKFIRQFFTDDVQTSLEYGFPVTVSALNAAKQAALDKIEKRAAEQKEGTGKVNGYMIGDDGVTIPIYDQGTRYETAADVEHIYDIVMSTKKQLGYDESIYNVIMEEASAYFSGEKSVEEVTKLINNRVGIILTENR